MAISGEGDWIWLAEHDQSRQDFAEALDDMTLKDLVALAMDSYPRVGDVDMIAAEVSKRELECPEYIDPDTGDSISDTLQHILTIRARMTDILNKGVALSRQDISPEKVIIIGTGGETHELRLTAFELADTGKLTKEEQILAALRAKGIIASINKREVVDGVSTSIWIEARNPNPLPDNPQTAIINTVTH